MATPNIVPRADSEGGLGTASKYWGSAYIDTIYVGAGKVGRDADNYIDFSTDNIVRFYIDSTAKLILNTARFAPNANDGTALGAATLGWSDLFLASGAVINFDNGNFTLTHSTSTITSSGHIAINDSKRLKLGNSHDLEIYHAPDHSYISNKTGTLYITNSADDNDIVFQCDDGSGGTTTYFKLDGSIASSGTVYTVFPDNSRATFGTGFDLQVYHDASNSYIKHLENGTGDLIISQERDDGDIIFKCDDGSGGTATYMFLDGSEKQIHFYQNTKHNDNVEARFGAGNDLKIYHDSSHSYIVQSGTGDLYIQNSVDDKDIYFQSDNGAGGVANYFYLDGSSAEHDGSATTALYTNWPDKSRASFGTSHDLQIEHNSVDSVIRNTVGDLYLMQKADDKDIIFQASTGSASPATYITLDGSAGLTKFHKDNKHLNSVKSTFGDSADLQIYHNGSNSYIQDAGTGELRVLASTLSVRNSGDNELMITAVENGAVNLYYDNSKKFETTAAGVTADSITTNTGSGAAVLGSHLDLGDNQKARFGASDDLQMYHDGTDSKIINSTGDLYINQTTDDKDIIFMSDDGSGGITEYLKIDGGDSQIKVSQNVKFHDNVLLMLGGSNDLQIYHDGTNSYINNATGKLFINNQTNDSDIIFRCDDGSGGATDYLTLDGGDVSTIVNTIKVLMPNLPTSDPSVAGQLWNSSGDLKISAG